MSTTTHDHALEQLPWFLNGTLEDDERREVEAHLATCVECRAELEATRDAFAVYAAHLPPEVLTAFVLEPEAGSWGVDGGRVERGLVVGHLAQCAECRSEVEMAREGLAAIEDPSSDAAASRGVLPFLPRRAPTAAPRWLSAALAASLLAAVVAGGGWFTAHRDAGESDQAIAELEQRLESAREELAAARREPGGETAGTAEVVTRLESQIAELERRYAETEDELSASSQRVEQLQAAVQRPPGNPVVATFLLDDLRSGAAGAPAVVADPEAPLVFQFLLDPGVEPPHGLSYRVVAADGAVIASGEPTLRGVGVEGRDAYLSIALRPAGLQRGDLTLEVVDGTRLVASHPFRVP
jgi:anti-sigma factor RsiW